MPAAVVVEGQFVLQPVSQRALIERHMALEQLEIKRDVEAVAEGIGDGLVGCHCLIIVAGIDANSRCVSVTRRIDALVLVIFPLRGCLPESAITVADVTIVDGHHLVAGDLDHGLLHDGVTQVLNHSPVCIFTNQRDSEGQAGSPWNNHVMHPEGRINYSQFRIDPDGKTLYWTPEDKKISVAATRGGFRFLALDTLAKRYGAGGTYALRRSLELTDYRLGVSQGLGKEAVETLQSAEETLPKNIESIELKDLSGATNDIIGTTGDVETALKSIEQSSSPVPDQQNL